ncbi:anthranilate synthase component II [Oceanibaculum pacificum]|uniref:Anthranilate synthase n=1 Tax=Oceanibaculum pacificum TaxID=580166 RepID=A0A154W2K1_9PROT|nr:aminodeoxychorismate/anthranilate synthase component II [Oceanibaculum pacificum]KZD07667.1 anthranilate synthase [Oceanibaculum pacificum]
MYILIDNYDSFTYNLWHFLGDLGAEVLVKRNDQITVDQVLAMRPEGVIISPGPCDPDRAGICLELIEKAKTVLPIFGVCLGHQAIGQAFGGKVVRGPVPMHGKMSAIAHQGKSVFKGLPSPLTATRYHSLIVEKDSLPDCFEVTAETEDGIIMGIAHKTLPIHGVQFHPESIATEHGHGMLRNFLDIAGRRNAA